MNKKQFSFALVLLLAFSFVTFKHNTVLAASDGNSGEPQYIVGCPIYPDGHHYDEISRTYYPEYYYSHDHIVTNPDGTLSKYPCWVSKDYLERTYECECGASYTSTTYTGTSHHY